jgi:DNA-binding XRE family transcriptional regulator
MPNVIQVLKAEIARVATKQAKAITVPIRKSAVAAKKAAASLRRRMAALEKDNRELKSTVAKLTAAQPAPAPEAADKVRVTAKGMRSLRRKLGLSGGEMGKLLGITSQAVYNLEKGSAGTLRVRSQTRDAILALRGLGAREAKRRLAEIKPAKQPPTRRRKRAKRG